MADVQAYQISKTLLSPRYILSAMVILTGLYLAMRFWTHSDENHARNTLLVFEITTAGVVLHTLWMVLLQDHSIKMLVFPDSGATLPAAHQIQGWAYLGNLCAGFSVFILTTATVIHSYNTTPEGYVFFYIVFSLMLLGILYASARLLCCWTTLANDGQLRHRTLNGRILEKNIQQISSITWSKDLVLHFSERTIKLEIVGETEEITAFVRLLAKHAPPSAWEGRAWAFIQPVLITLSVDKDGTCVWKNHLSEEIKTFTLQDIQALASSGDKERDEYEITLVLPSGEHLVVYGMTAESKGIQEFWEKIGSLEEL